MRKKKKSNFWIYSLFGLAFILVTSFFWHEYIQIYEGLVPYWAFALCLTRPLTV
jgi:hypothetical protein